MLECRVGRGYLIQAQDARNPKDMGSIKQYDVEFVYGGRHICTLATNCYGQKSMEYWYRYWKNEMHKLIYLTKMIDAENNNLLAYSDGSNILTVPKSGCEVEWQEAYDNVEMLTGWFKKLMDGFGKDVSSALIKEFDIYYE